MPKVTSNTSNYYSLPQRINTITQMRVCVVLLSLSLSLLSYQIHFYRKRSINFQNTLTADDICIIWRPKSYDHPTMLTT